MLSILNKIINRITNWFKSPSKPYRYKGVRGLDGELY